MADNAKTLDTLAANIRERAADPAWKQFVRAQAALWYKDLLKWEEAFFADLRDARKKRVRGGKCDTAGKSPFDDLEFVEHGSDSHCLHLTEYMFDKGDAPYAGSDAVVQAACVFVAIFHDWWFRRDSQVERLGDGIWESAEQWVQDMRATFEGFPADRVAVEVVARMKAVDGAVPTGGGGGKQVEWDLQNLDYMPASEAVVEFTNCKLSLSKLSKMLRPDGPIGYMRSSNHRCRVHIGDFRTWAKDKYPPDSFAAEIADEYVADIEARKASERNRRGRK